MSTRVLSLFVLLFLAAEAQAQWIPQTLEAQFVVGVPAGPERPVWPEARVIWNLQPGPWALAFSYAFRSKEYYFYDHGRDRWNGPQRWSDSKAGGVDESVWPFYQTRHVLSPGLVFRLPDSWVRPSLALGLLIQFYVPADSTDFYPDYEAGFDAFNSQVQAIFGNDLRGGVDFDIWSWLYVGVDFVFEVPDWGQFYSDIQRQPAQYAMDHANWELHCGVRL